jgi:N6-adenosine-specific RNA methylase IME4
VSGKYRTIVADPPWDHSDGTGTAFIDGAWVQRGGVPYDCMDLDAIRRLPVGSMAATDSHLYLWTTNRFLEATYGIARGWGFEPVKPIAWCKPPIGPFMGGAWGGASLEFCLFCRRGSLKHTDRAGRQWFAWPRGAHSAKPEAFLDIVEQVSPGPYVELFARRARFGWDYWGNESLGTAEMAA